MKKLLLLMAGLIFIALPAQAQNSFFNDHIINGSGRPVAGVNITVCTYSGTDYDATGKYIGVGPPCTATVSIFTDQAGAHAKSNPFVSDGLGNYFFWAPSANYTLCATGPNVTGSCQAITVGGSGGGGSGTVTHTTGAMNAGQLAQGNGGADIKPGDLTGDAQTAGTLATTVFSTHLTAPLPFAQGGFGINSAISGGIPCFPSTSSVASSVLLNSNVLPMGGGSGACPTNSHESEAGGIFKTTLPINSGTVPSGCLATITDGFCFTEGGSTGFIPTVGTIYGRADLTTNAWVWSYNGGAEEIGPLIHGAITAGHCTSWFSAFEIQDAGAACGSGGSGVTSFSAGNLSPLFTTSVATPTTTPALSFTLSNAAANTVFGNPTNSSAAPVFTANPSVTSVTTGQAAFTCTPGTGGVDCIGEGTTGTFATGQDGEWGDSVLHCRHQIWNNVEQGCTAALLASTNAFAQLSGCWHVNANQTLAQAITGASSSGCIVIDPGTYALAANATIPAGVTTWFMGGGGLTTTGFTLTINGPLNANPAQQIFFGTGTVNISRPTSPVMAAWFPGSDIGAQINAAYAAAGGSAFIQFPPASTNAGYSYTTAISLTTADKYAMLQCGPTAPISGPVGGGCTLNFTPTTAPATTAASLTTNVVTLTMASNPQTFGFVVGEGIIVSGFTGADTFFNCGPTAATQGCNIASVTSTQITYKLTHANGTASTTGAVAPSAITIDYGSAGGTMVGMGLNGLFIANNNCNTAGGCGNAPIGIYCGTQTNTGCGFSDLHNVRIQGFGVGEYIPQGTSYGVQHNLVQYQANTIGWENSTQGHEMQTWTGGQFVQNGTGAVFNGPVNASFNSTHFDDNTTVAISSPSSTNGSIITIKDCHFENNLLGTAHYLNVGTGVSVNMVGGGIADDLSTGTPDWMLQSSGVTMTIYGTMVQSVRNYTSASQGVVLANSPVQVDAQFDNATSNTLPNIFSSASTSTVLSLRTLNGFNGGGLASWAFASPFYFNGNSTITSNPPANPTAANNAGWKHCYFSNTTCVGVANQTEAHLISGAGNWFSIFAANPGNNATSTVPDSGAKVSLGTNSTIVLPQAAAPTGIGSSGIIYEDSTQIAAEVNNNNTGNMPISRVLCVNVTPVTVNTSTTSDQNLMSCTLSANLLNVVGRTLKVYLAGVYSNVVTSQPTVTLKIKLCTVSGCGSGTVISPISIASTVTSATAVTNLAANETAYIVTQTAGASAAFEAHGNMAIDLGTTNLVADSIFADVNTATVGTISSTGQLFLQVAVAFSGSSTSNSFTERQLIVEVVN